MKSELFLFLVLGALLSSALTHPSKPLNERSTELAWQAWLLVDQSQKNPDVGQLRRRITPKSVFIAPTFSPDSLPACAEGYRSDSMGRCVKIIKIDESVHLEFLLQKLNEQFSDYEEEPEEIQTQGPFQVNIPLGLDDDGFLDNEATDMAIVVAPTTSMRKDVKFDVKRNDNDKFNKENIAAILGVKPEDLESTTFDGISTTTVVDSTTVEAATESTTLDTTTFETTLRQETSETVTDERTESTNSYRGEEDHTNGNQQRDEDSTNRNQQREEEENTDRNPSGNEEEGEAIFFKWRF